MVTVINGCRFSIKNIHLIAISILKEYNVGKTLHILEMIKMGKRVIGFLLILCIIISCNLFTVGAAPSKVKVTVKLDSIECVQNNHVGNEWAFGCTVNKKALTEGNSISVSTISSGKITIVSTVEEEDSIPDIGSKTLSITVSKLKENKDTTYTSSVTVTENRGRYSGNKAIWKFTFIVKRS